MDFDYYRNFISIVEAGTLTSAAQKLNLAQPALSAQLRIMEQYYDAKLLKTQRGARKLELTEAGKVFYEKAKQLCILESSARLEVQNALSGVAGVLRISISPARAPFFVKRYIKPFCRIYPGISYQIHEVDVYMQMQHITNNISEIAIANAPLPDSKKFQILTSQKEHFIVAINKRNTLPINTMSKLTIKDLNDQLLCTNFGSYQLLNKIFKENKITAKFVSVSTTRTVSLQFAEHNLGIAIIPAEKSENFSKEIKTFLLDEEQLFLTKTVFVAKNRTLSSIAKIFLDFYQMEAKKIFDNI